MAINYGEKPETIKIETADTEPKVGRDFIRPINMMRSGDTIVWEDTGDYPMKATFLVGKEISSKASKTVEGGFRQRVFTKDTTIYELELVHIDTPEEYVMPRYVKDSYDSFFEREVIELLTD